MNFNFFHSGLVKRKLFSFGPADVLQKCAVRGNAKYRSAAIASKLHGGARLFAALVLITTLVSTASISRAGTWTDLSADELQSLMKSGKSIFLLNPLSEIEYNEGNIPGSVNIPLHTIMSSKELPKDKDTLIITYCLGRK